MTDDNDNTSDQSRLVITRAEAKAYYVSVSGGKAVEKVLEPEMIA